MSLYDSLLAAGLPVVSASDTQATFSRTLNWDEEIIYENILFPHRREQQARKAAAKSNALAIPSWAKWTEAEALDWGNANIGQPLIDGRNTLPATLTLTTARAAIVSIINVLDKMWAMQWALAKMVIALRDENWPDLPNK